MFWDPYWDNDGPPKPRPNIQVPSWCSNDHDRDLEFAGQPTNQSTNAPTTSAPTFTGQPTNQPTSAPTTSAPTYAGQPTNQPTSASAPAPARQYKLIQSKKEINRRLKYAAEKGKNAVNLNPGKRQVLETYILGNSKKAQNDFPGIAKLLLQVKDCVLAFDAQRVLKSIFNQVGSAHKFSLAVITYASLSRELLESTRRLDITKAYGMSPADFNRARTACNQNHFIVWEQPLVKEQRKTPTNFVAGYPRVTDEEAELYIQFFIDNTHHMSGDQTSTRHLLLKLHELHAQLHAEFPARIRQLLQKYHDQLKYDDNTRWGKALQWATACPPTSDEEKTKEVKTRHEEHTRGYQVQVYGNKLRSTTHAAVTLAAATKMFDRDSSLKNEYAPTTINDDDPTINDDERDWTKNEDTQIEHVVHVTGDTAPEDPSEHEGNILECRPVTMKTFWRLLKHHKMRWSVKIHPHECPIHDKGPVWVKQQDDINGRLAKLEQKLAIVEKYVDIPANADEATRIRLLYSKLLGDKRWKDEQVNSYIRHKEQFKTARAVYSELERTIEPLIDVIIIRDFVNQYMWDGAKMSNLVLVARWREVVGGPLLTMKFNNLCTHQDSRKTDAYFVADVFDFHFSSSRPESNFFESFKRVYVVGDHGPHFTSIQTVFNESRMYEHYDKEFFIYSLCSYHAYNRCDGAGVETKRVATHLIKARKGPTSAGEVAEVFNKTNHNNAVAVNFPQINRSLDTFPVPLVKGSFKAGRDVENATFRLAKRNEIKYSWWGADGKKYFEAGVMLCRDISYHPNNEEGKKVLYDVFDLRETPPGGLLCITCSKTKQRPIRHEIEDCPLMEGSVALKQRALNHCGSGPDVQRVQSQQLTKTFMANQAKPIGAYPCRVPECHGYHYFTRWFDANRHMVGKLNKGEFLLSGHNLQDDDELLYKDPKPSGSHPCRVPGCTQNHYTTSSGCNKHMREKHQLKEGDARFYEPKPAAKAEPAKKPKTKTTTTVVSANTVSSPASSASLSSSSPSSSSAADMSSSASLSSSASNTVSSPASSASFSSSSPSSSSAADMSSSSGCNKHMREKHQLEEGDGTIYEPKPAAKAEPARNPKTKTTTTVVPANTVSSPASSASLSSSHQLEEGGARFYEPKPAAKAEPAWKPKTKTTTTVVSANTVSSPASSASLSSSPKRSSKKRKKISDKKPVQWAQCDNLECGMWRNRELSVRNKGNATNNTEDMESKNYVCEDDGRTCNDPCDYCVQKEPEAEPCTCPTFATCAS
jgi:hypothetical protein